ncbi:hypothetical protein DFR67_12311 [Williamsia limnetica]|uniref:Antitoxin VbhA domain-containing protein n=1 Tax=Williamsia limnetica TaxID=882452 RepID=A0A318R9H4_WILLI|nr:hypothetical protein [Williamsia limnetica]PYE12288.1 hypothetical protein DFR67_12311 [Williamsia limnetica]
MGSAAAGEPLTPRERRIVAGVNAGEVMETGTELSEDDIAAALWVVRGESAADEEVARLLTEIRAASEDKVNEDG